MRILVVGSSIVDVIARPTSVVESDASNEGVVLWGAGGAGRNVAENLARLGAQVTLITDLAEDFPGRFLLDNIRSLGIEARVAKRERTGLYLALLNSDGSLDRGFCSTATERVEAKDVLAQLPDLAQFQGAVLDANLKAETTAALAARFRDIQLPFALETAAHERSLRIRPALPGCALIKPDRVEARVLTGLPCDSLQEAFLCAETLRGQGAQRVIVSLGADGFIYLDGTHRIHRAAAPTQVVDVTGAGDALFSAAFLGILQKMDIEELLHAAALAAALACASPTAVNPDMGPEIFMKRQE